MHIIMNKLSKIIIVLFSSLFLSFAANSVELKFGHVGKPGSLFSASVDHFAKLANKRLGSKGKVTVFGSSQLGKDKQGMQKLKLGTVNMWLPSSVMASIHDEFGVFDMPFIIKDRKHMAKVEKNVLPGMFKNLEDKTGYKVKRILVYPNKKLSLQSHYYRSEHWVIVKGTGKVQIGKDFLTLTKNMNIFIPKETIHRIENVGNTDLIFIETQVGTYLGEDDIIRYEDDYGRV